MFPIGWQDFDPIQNQDITDTRYAQLLFYRRLKVARLMVKKSFIIISRSLTVIVACLKKILLFVCGAIYLNDISEQSANLLCRRPYKCSHSR